MKMPELTLSEKQTVFTWLWKPKPYSTSSPAIARTWAREDGVPSEIGEQSVCPTYRPKSTVQAAERKSKRQGKE